MRSLVANMSLLFRDLPMPDRFAAAADAGFDEVESWWPFLDGAPSAADVDAFVDAVDRSGTALVGLNLYAGDQPGGERGILSHPGRVAEFRDSVAVARDIAQRTGLRVSNALYGQRLPDAEPAEQDAVARDNLAFAAEALAPAGVVLLLEALTHPGNGDYPLRTLDDAEAVRRDLEDRGVGGVGLLADTFHLAGNGVDLTAALRAHAPHVAHVQLADFPGRGAPGTGSIDFPSVLAALDEVGYRGRIAAEFSPGDRPVSHAAILEALVGRTGSGRHD